MATPPYVPVNHGHGTKLGQLGYRVALSLGPTSQLFCNIRKLVLGLVEMSFSHCCGKIKLLWKLLFGLYLLSINCLVTLDPLQGVSWSAIAIIIYTRDSEANVYYIPIMFHCDMAYAPKIHKPTMVCIDTFQFQYSGNCQNCVSCTLCAAWSQ